MSHLLVVLLPSVSALLESLIHPSQLMSLVGQNAQQDGTARRVRLSGICAPTLLLLPAFSFSVLSVLIQMFISSLLFKVFHSCSMVVAIFVFLACNPLTQQWAIIGKTLRCRSTSTEI